MPPRAMLLDSNENAVTAFPIFALILRTVKQILCKSEISTDSSRATTSSPGGLRLHAMLMWKLVEQSGQVPVEGP
jgi:hypothetical protein